MEVDSLTPHLVAIAQSRRTWLFTWSFLKWLLPVVSGSILLPTFMWVTTRYDVESARKLTERVVVVEKVVGLPDAQELEREREAQLRTRVKNLERQVDVAEQMQLEHDLDVFDRVVSAQAACGQPPSKRKEAARDASELFRAWSKCSGEVGNPLNPFRCAVAPIAAARLAMERDYR